MFELSAFRRVSRAAGASSSLWAVAFRATLREGYGWGDFRRDLAAGAVVGLVALPLSMALAIASGAPPQHGLYTAIVAGLLIAMLGGARTSVSGPTAAFVVILAPITAKYGIGGLMLATVMAGALQIAMGWAKLGRWIQFVPHPVTTGFTSGIAVVIATLQIKDLLGLSVDAMPEHYWEKAHALFAAMPTVRWSDAAIGLGTLALLWLWPKINCKVPAPLVALPLAAIAAWAASAWLPNFEVHTIRSRFVYEVGGQTLGGIPRGVPGFGLPWMAPGADGAPVGLSLQLLRELALPAVAIALLGAIESLLCAVVADGMTGQKHDPDGELFAQGLGNVVAPLFGGFAATAAIARTATNIRAGGRSPVAAIAHSLFVLSAMLVLSPALGYLPMASLAALLLVVAAKMSEVRHFVRIVRLAPRGDTVVLVVCFALTVLFDMVVSVSVGVVLASLIFMRRMADLAAVDAVPGEHPELFRSLPPHVLLYEISGPLFFGAAEKAAAQLIQGRESVEAVIVHMGDVPTMDVTGLVALESALRKLRERYSLVVLSGVQPQPRAMLARAGLCADGKVSICPTLSEAEMVVRLACPTPVAAAPATAA